MVRVEDVEVPLWPTLQLILHDRFSDQQNHSWGLILRHLKRRMISKGNTGNSFALPPPPRLRRLVASANLIVVQRIHLHPLLRRWSFTPSWMLSEG